MRGRERGFTLIELLVAMTVFALLATIVLGALRFGVRGAAQGTARREWTEEVAVAANFLRNQIADAQPLQKEEDGKPSIAFEGEPGGVEFVALPPAHLAPGGWSTLRVGFEADDGRGRVVLTWTPVRADAAGAAPPPRRSVLLDGVSGVAFSYFGATQPGEEPQWHERWESLDAMPLLMRLTFDFTNGRHVPDLIIALRAAPPAPGF